LSRFPGKLPRPCSFRTTKPMVFSWVCVGQPATAPWMWIVFREPSARRPSHPTRLTLAPPVTCLAYGFPVPAFAHQGSHAADIPGRMYPEGRLDSGLHSDAQDQPRLFSSGEGLTIFIGSEKTTGSKPDEPGFATPRKSPRQSCHPTRACT